MTSRPTGMRSGFSVDTPDDYVLGSAKISYSFGPAVVQIFLTNSRQIGCKEYAFPRKEVEEH